MLRRFNRLVQRSQKGGSIRTIIAGSRHITEYQTLVDVMATLPWTPTVVISGCARGVDTLGERYAKEHKIPLEKFPANWVKYGRGAGPIRNQQMVDVAEALVALPVPGSRGTSSMIRIAGNAGLDTYVCVITQPEPGTFFVTTPRYTKRR